MKGETDVVAHVAGATGVAEQEVRRVIDAAFAYLRASALAGEEVSHPSLGAIRPRQRDKGGVTVTVYRFMPGGEAAAGGAGGAGRAGAGKAGRGKAGGGGARRGGKAGGGGRGRRGGGAGGGDV